MTKIVLCMMVAVIFCVVYGADEAGGKPASGAAASGWHAKSPPDVSSNPDSIAMVFVEGGTFVMGCTNEQHKGDDDDEPGKECDDNAARFKTCDCDEKPAHKVTLSSFYVGKYEVTQGIWKAVMGGNPSDTFSGRYGVGDDYPVYYVNWNDVMKFIAALNAKTGKNYRLPTEAEWEFAARGGNKSKGYMYSGSDSLGDVTWYRDGNRTYGTSAFGTKPVGTKAPNELGVYDMSGNVWEWVSDWYGYKTYASSPVTNPTGPKKGTCRVIRGGSWATGWGRVSNRNCDPQSRSGRYFRLGFRLAHP